MEHEQLPLFIMFGIALISFIYLGWTHRTKNPSEYHTLNRQVTFVRVLTSSFTIVGASEFVIFATLTYIFGVYSLLFFLGTFLGFYALSFLTKRIFSIAENRDFHSIPDLAYKHENTNISVILSIFSTLFTSCLVVIQLIIGGMLISQITGWDYSIIIILLAIGVFGYLYFGGYKALMFTDIIQGIILFLFTIIIAIFLSSKINDINLISSVPFSESWGDYLILFLGGFFAIFGGPEIWQRILTSKNQYVAKKGLQSTAWIMLFWGIALIFASLVMRELLPNINENDVFFEFLALELPFYILGVVIILLLTAIISTADTELFAGSVIVQKEYLRVRKDDTELNIQNTRVILLILLTLITFFALVYNNILNIYFSLVYITFITGSFGFILLLKRGNKLSFYVASILSLIMYFYIIFNDLLISWYPALILFCAILPILFKNEK